jgi:hypothetical protein
MDNYVMGMAFFPHFHRQLLSKMMHEFVIVSSVSLYWHRTELRTSCHIPLDAKYTEAAIKYNEFMKSNIFYDVK